ncbi:hypothetical protein BZA70DRAFT_20412 [Myxozyma melibiosi]|uniref:Vacuolar ATPase assembly protein VMA22 n=1 Tax=Myxozyma melibiosi TaxID=54550 RepID=A0ABR1FCP2_9ASCO
MALESEISKLALGDDDGKAQQQPIAEPGTELSVAQDGDEKTEEKKEEEELVDPAGLSSSFDKLLFEYCELVDTYQSLRLRLSHLFAEGFLNLAQANYGRSRGHFGRDQYHGNMHASRILELTDKTFTPLYVSSETNDLSYVGLSMTDAAVPAEDMAELEKKEKEKRAKLEAAAAAAAAAAGESAPAEEKIKDLKEQVGASGADTSATTRRRKGATEQSKDGEKEDDEKKESVEKKETVAKPKLPLRMDPIRWFGVLVPQQLRLSQRCFGEATETVAELVSVCNRMDALEGYIRQVRKS